MNTRDTEAEIGSRKSLIYLSFKRIINIIDSTNTLNEAKLKYESEKCFAESFTDRMRIYGLSYDVLKQRLRDGDTKDQVVKFMQGCYSRKKSIAEKWKNSTEKSFPEPLKSQHRYSSSPFPIKPYADTFLKTLSNVTASPPDFKFTDVKTWKDLLNILIMIYPNDKNEFLDLERLEFQKIKNYINGTEKNYINGMDSIRLFTLLIDASLQIHEEWSFCYISWVTSSETLIAFKDKLIPNAVNKKWINKIEEQLKKLNSGSSTIEAGERNNPYTTGGKQVHLPRSTFFGPDNHLNLNFNLPIDLTKEETPKEPSDPDPLKSFNPSAVEFDFSNVADLFNPDEDFLPQNVFKS